MTDAASTVGRCASILPSHGQLLLCVFYVNLVTQSPPADTTAGSRNASVASDLQADGGEEAVMGSGGGDTEGENVDMESCPRQVTHTTLHGRRKRYQVYPQNKSMIVVVNVYENTN